MTDPEVPADPSISHARRLSMVSSFVAAIDPPGPWAEDAACIGQGPLFDHRRPHEARAGFQARTRAARAICESCPVLSRCRDWTAATPRAKVAGTLAGHYFRVFHPGMAGFHAKTTTFPVTTKAA